MPPIELGVYLKLGNKLIIARQIVSISVVFGFAPIEFTSDATFLIRMRRVAALSF